MRQRFWEIDVLRGFSVLAMVIYHELWNLWFFGGITQDVTTGVGRIIGQSIGTMFLFLVGVSLYISHERARKRLSSRELIWKSAVRSLKLLCWAAGITLVTSLALDAPVFFGILHIISFSVIAAYPLMSRPWLAGIFGVILVFCAQYTPLARLPSDLFLPLGIFSVNRTMVDYYPIVPWFGVVLLGVFLGEVFYPKGSRRWALEKSQRNQVVYAMEFLGRHSLAVYLIHQPILFALTYGLTRLAG